MNGLAPEVADDHLRPAVLVPWQIRPAAPKDLAGIMAIERSAFVDPYPKWLIAQEFRVDVSRFFVLEDGEDSVGFINFWHIGDTIDIINIAVHKDWQGRGYGNHLLVYLHDYAQHHGCASLLLEVAAANRRALALYAKWGYRRVGVRKNYYRLGEDALVMRFDLVNCKDVSPGHL